MHVYGDNYHGMGRLGHIQRPRDSEVEKETHIQVQANGTRSGVEFVTCWP